MEPITSVAELLHRAKEAEKQEAIDQAITLYELVLKADKFIELAYDRLMILYRKQKDYKNELKTIDNGIKAFENLNKPKVSRTKIKKVADISLAFMKSTGLSDKKGNILYEPEPIASWKKRKQVVEGKISKAK